MDMTQRKVIWSNITVKAIGNGSAYVWVGSHVIEPPTFITFGIEPSFNGSAYKRLNGEKLEVDYEGMYMYCLIMPQ